MESSTHSIALDRDRYYSDMRVMESIIHSLATRLVEMSRTELLTEAYEYAIENTDLDADDIRDVIEEHALFDTDLCQREYNVIVTVPVTVTLTIKANDADTAEMEAMSMIEYDGLDNFNPDYDLSWGLEVEVENV